LSCPSKYWIEFSTSTSRFRECFRWDSHHPRRCLIRVPCRHHVGRDRPRRAAETDQRDVRIELAAHATQRFIDRLEFAKVACDASVATFSESPGDQAAALADLEPTERPSGRESQDIQKMIAAIEVETGGSAAARNLGRRTPV